VVNSSCYLHIIRLVLNCISIEFKPIFKLGIRRNNPNTEVGLRHLRTEPIACQTPPQTVGLATVLALF
jgi:hypothetical protein